MTRLGRPSPKGCVEPSERDALPEVWDLVQGVAGIDDIRRTALVLVGQEAGLDHLDVIQPG